MTVPGRECGSCSYCCKLLGIEELAKPAGRWCQHCEPGGVRCKIYESRPRVCQEFECQWLRSDSFGPEWEPKKCAMVVSVDEQPKRIRVSVDVSAVGRWREKPYTKTMRALARLAAQEEYQLIVSCAGRHWQLVPGGEIELSRAV